MIVIAAPRCGGTIFTSDLAKKLNLIFVGETKALYVQGYLKDRLMKPHLHETKNQPLHSVDLWIDTIINPNKYAILLNQRDSYPVFPKANYFLLRKNFNNIVGSYLKWLKWTENFYQFKMSIDNKITEIHHLIHTIHSICLWCKNTNTAITWYEDFYHTPNYELTEELNFYVKIIHKTNLENIFIECGGNQPEYKL